MNHIARHARIFGLAAALGLATSANEVPKVAGSFLLLCAIAAVASVPQPTEAARRAVPIIEGALVGLALAVDGLASQPLALYLIVPVLIAGLVGGTLFIALTLASEIVMMAASSLVRQQFQTLPDTLSEALPWLLTGLGIGLLGSRIRRLRSSPPDVDHAGYVVAHRLLDELRVVSRRLSSGLDPVEQSTTLLNDCLGLVPGARGTILVQTNGGALVPLAQHLGDMPWDAGNDSVVALCWRTGETAHRTAASRLSTGASPHPSAGADTIGFGRERWAIPLRVGSRSVGVLALDVSGPLTGGLEQQVRRLLDERALPLDTAMLFEEVRALATVEERQRLAREIHDGVAQELASLGYLVDHLALAPDTTRAVEVAHLRGELTRIVDDLRLSIFDLRSQVSRTTGLGSVLAEYLREMGSRSNTAVHLTLDETPDRLRLDVEEQLLRIVQEAVTNARKHSDADNLWVFCRVRPPTAHLVVEDDGSGVRQDASTEGFGLSIMRERASRIGAMLAITTRPGGGTRVSIDLPLPLHAGEQTRAEPLTRTPKLLARPVRKVAPHG
jgi:signal transduction histidine kinase